ncbi:MAG TPA: hypothetical protein VHT30_03830 [Acidimicrobiales bacterium]|nr:hypothetical protein [Acidimicrobiales bacterium]
MVFGFLLAAAAFLLLGFAVSATAAVTGNLQKGDSRGGAFGGSAILLILIAVLVWTAWIVEHRARVHQDQQGTSGLNATDRADRAPGDRPPVASTRAGRSPEHARYAHFAVVAGCVLIAVFFLGLTIDVFAGWRHSTSVQSHGVRTTGIVKRIDMIVHDTRGGSYTTINLEVMLVPPIGGRTLATVHTPESTAPAAVGDTIPVLVDPSNTGYAELPGKPAQDLIGSIVGLLAVVIFLVLAVSAFIGYREARKKAST